MDLFSYILKNDSGFAPNPFGSVCTLACCKPKIRERANIGDWVIGTSPSPDNRKLIYAMKVSRALTFDLYFSDPTYSCKKNSPDNPCGDNIYRSNSKGQLEQVEGAAHSQKHISRDLSVNRVLISDHFYYFGNQAPELDIRFASLVHSTQSHKRIKMNNDPAIYERFLSLVSWVEENYKSGVLGEPTTEKIVCYEDDDEEE